MGRPIAIPMGTEQVSGLVYDSYGLSESTVPVFAFRVTNVADIIDQHSRKFAIQFFRCNKLLICLFSAPCRGRHSNRKPRGCHGHYLWRRVRDVHNLWRLSVKFITSDARQACSLPLTPRQRRP